MAIENLGNKLIKLKNQTNTMLETANNDMAASETMLNDAVAKVKQLQSRETKLEAELDNTKDQLEKETYDHLKTVTRMNSYYPALSAYKSMWRKINKIAGGITNAKLRENVQKALNFKYHKLYMESY